MARVKKVARKARQTERRAKYGGKTFLQRATKSIGGAAIGLLTGNPSSAIESLTASQKVEQSTSTPAEIMKRAEDIAATSNPTTTKKETLAEMIVGSQPLNPAAIKNNNVEDIESEDVPAKNSNYKQGDAGKGEKKENNKSILVIVVVCALLLVVVAISKSKKNA